MNMREIMFASPVMPVIVIEKIEYAVPLARTLCAGGIRVLEVTLRTPVALDAVRAIAEQVPEAIVGVGTVVTPEQFTQARDAGARFAVSPGYTTALGDAANWLGMPYLPGVFTPSEAMVAMSQGYDALKLYPAKQAGGIGMIKALAGPLSQLVFCPSGGVTQESAPEFLALPNVACVGGSWLTPVEAQAAGDWEAIRQLAQAAALLRV